MNSIILQKDIDFEVIVADDCSQDNYFGKIEDFFARHSFTNYQLTAHEKNQGIVKNLLDGAEYAKGDYVKAIGQGDMMSDEYALKELFDDCVKTGACMSSSQCVDFYGYKTLLNLQTIDVKLQDGNIYRNGSLEEKQDSILFKRNVPSGPASIYKREVLIKYLKIFSDAGIIYTEDLIPWLMAAEQQEKISFFNRITVFYEGGVGVCANPKYAKLIHKDQETLWKLIIERNKTDRPDLVDKLNIFLRRQNIKRKLGSFAGIVLVPFRFLKRIHKVLREDNHASINFPTDFVKLCISRE